MSIGIETIPNKRGRDTVLMRRYWRNGKKVEKETLLTLTDFPVEVIQGFDAVLRGGAAFRSLNDAIQVRRALPHGHIAAALFTAPGSKLDTARRLSSSTADSSLGHLLDLGEAAGNEMLSMLDWLLKRQRWIERSLARRYLNDGTLILYDVSSSCLEGRCCPWQHSVIAGMARRAKRKLIMVFFALRTAAQLRLKCLQECLRSLHSCVPDCQNPGALWHRTRGTRWRPGHDHIGTHPGKPPPSRPGLGLSPADTGHPSAAAVVNTAAEPRDAGCRHRRGNGRPGLSGRKAAGLHESPSSRRTREKARESAEGSRGRARADCRIGPIGTTEGKRRNRATDRS